MNKHTQTPWTVEGDLSGLWISGPDRNAPVVCDIMGRDGTHTATDEDVANAEFIVRAVNCHDELLAACKLLMKWVGPPPQDRHSFDSLREDGWKAARAAVAKAEAL